MSAAEAFIAITLAVLALAALWCIGVHEHRARRSIREFDQPHPRGAEGWCSDERPRNR
jgi:hypothetical protein